MPAKSQAERKYLNWKFGHAWVKKHHFDNKGKLPAYVGPKTRNQVGHHHKHDGAHRPFRGR